MRRGSSSISFTLTTCRFVTDTWYGKTWISSITTGFVVSTGFSAFTSMAETNLMTFPRVVPT